MAFFRELLAMATWVALAIVLDWKTLGALILLDIVKNIQMDARIKQLKEQILKEIKKY